MVEGSEDVTGEVKLLLVKTYNVNTTLVVSIKFTLNTNSSVLSLCSILDMQARS